MMKSETKTGGTKRRAYDVFPLSSTSNAPSTIARRVNKIARDLKIKNPNHMYTASAAVAWNSISNTGTAFDLGSQIQQGTNYADRFGTKIRMKRFILRGILLAGTTAAATLPVRITVIRAESGTAFAANTTNSYNPLFTGTSLQLYYDKFFSIPSTIAAAGFPVNLNLSINLKGHMQKYSGTGLNTTTGDSIFCIIQSTAGAGTGAPTIIGNLEVFFDPM